MKPAPTSSSTTKPAKGQAKKAKSSVRSPLPLLDTAHLS